MRFRGVVVGAAAVLVGLAVPGCQSAVAGSPTTGTTQPAATGGGTSSGTPPSDRLSPPVDNPKDLRGVDPCELLTPEQRAELGLRPGEKEDISPWGEETCGFGGSIVSIGFSPDTTLGEGLDQAYRAKDSFENFAETTVDGYPAVRVNFATQICSLIVGVSDTQTLGMDFARVSSSAPGRGDPCGFAESVLGEVIKNLPDA
jgi:hypothetical protein